MPEITLPLHELWHRHKEIPDVPDCYLIEIWSDDFPEGDPEGECLYPTPWHAKAVAPLQAAREQNDYTWDYIGYGWDGESKDHFRMDNNTPGVRHPVHLKFHWGEGHPKTDGIEPLPHIKMVQRGHEMEYCDYCRYKPGAMPKDCPTRRLLAIQEAVKNGQPLDLHLRAITLWHSETMAEEWKRRV